MRDQLLGYALGALDAPEHEEVEAQLDQDPWLREQLELLQKALAPLECDREHHEPPAGLANETCRRVLAVERQDGPGGAAPSAFRSADHERGRGGVLRGWSLVDLAVAAGIVLAAGALFFPAINHIRFNAQLTNCQNNLAEIGRALHSYSQFDPRGEYPAIPTSGKLSAAGIYAPKLLASGHLSDPKLFRCALSDADGSSVSESPINAKIPTLDELNAAQGDALQALLARAGGSYGYTLGYDQDGGYHPTRSLGRSDFPIMSDTPCPKLQCQQSSNHGGYGQNVLFDDGHVRYLTTCRLPEGCPDRNFFRNADGRIAAGKNINDAVIGGSLARPLEDELSPLPLKPYGQGAEPAGAQLPPDGK